jgi:hypothetical protein
MGMKTTFRFEILFNYLDFKSGVLNIKEASLIAPMKPKTKTFPPLCQHAARVGCDIGGGLFLP